MPTRDRAGTLDAVANRLQVMADLTTALRRSAMTDAPTVVELEGEVDRVVRLLRTVHPTRKEKVSWARSIDAK